MSLYATVKPLLPEAKAFISDQEMLLLNRKDYQQTQINPVHAYLAEMGFKVGYPYRLLLALIEQFAKARVGADFNIVLSDPSMLAAALYTYIRAGGMLGRGKVYAPKGVQRIPPKNSILGELITDFEQATIRDAGSKVEADRRDFYTFVLGNTKDSNQTIFAVDRFSEASKGLLILKDFARVDAMDEREYMEAKFIFPSVTLEGHGYALR